MESLESTPLSFPDVYIGGTFGFQFDTSNKYKIRCTQLRRKKRLQQIQSKMHVPPAEHKEFDLLSAVSHGDVSRVRHLLASGADACTSDHRKRTPLHIASAQGNADVARLLLEHGADPDAPDCQGSTALHLAAATGKQGVVEAILEFSPDLKQRDKLGRTVMHIAGSRLRMVLSEQVISSGESKAAAIQIVTLLKDRLSLLAEKSVNEEKDIEDLTLKMTKTFAQEQIVSLKDLLDSLNEMKLMQDAS